MYLTTSRGGGGGITMFLYLFDLKPERKNESLHVQTLLNFDSSVCVSVQVNILKPAQTDIRVDQQQPPER